MDLNLAEEFKKNCFMNQVNKFIIKKKKVVATPFNLGVPSQEHHLVMNCEMIKIYSSTIFCCKQLFHFYDELGSMRIGFSPRVAL